MRPRPSPAAYLHRGKEEEEEEEGKEWVPGRAALPERPEPEEPDRHQHPRAALTAPGMHCAAPPQRRATPSGGPQQERRARDREGGWRSPAFAVVTGTGVGEGLLAVTCADAQRQDVAVRLHAVEALCIGKTWKWAHVGHMMEINVRGIYMYVYIYFA